MENLSSRSMADQRQDALGRKERIQELASIESDVTGSLLAAAKAIKAMSGESFGEDASSEEQTDSNKQLTAEEARQLFEKHTSEFMSHVQAVGARLKRQVYALEEAGIIPATAKDEETQQQAAAAATAASKRAVQAVSLAVTAPQREEAAVPITNRGLGNFDIGWLNSRRDDVGRQKESQLWAEAKELLERIQQQEDGDNDKMTDG